MAGDGTNNGNAAVGGTLRDLVVRYMERVDQHIADDKKQAETQDGRHIANTARLDAIAEEGREGRKKIHEKIDGLAAKLTAQNAAATNKEIALLRWALGGAGALIVAIAGAALKIFLESKGVTLP